MSQQHHERQHENVVFGEGNVNIVLTSPHGGSREIGSTKIRSAPGSCHVQDTNTNKMLNAVLEYLKKHSEIRPYYVMGNCHRKYCDLNRNPNNAYEEEEAGQYYHHYHSKIASYVSEFFSKYPNRKNHLLIDIHGQSTLKDHTMRGTQNGATVAKLIQNYGESAILQDGFFGSLEKISGTRIYPANTGQGKWAEHKDYNGGWTVCYYSGHRKLPNDNFTSYIDAIQLEIGYDFRKDDKAIEAFGSALAQTIIQFYSKYISQEN
eukprot:TRINITY_DN7909_c0_g1_i1.p1 TRINITY_DN7909_c0_g1~~TRINITY_DN7909_c0_g1_i1.p1  ORF type:complete len:263 (-),score=54.48 TRINITY_DN7909_c0_g1_i1:35-823(-)